MMIESIEIKNFRGIQDLKIQGFKNFNIFVGENSCGKTSVLEAIAICYGIEEPESLTSLVKIQNFRRIFVLPSNLSSIFHNLEFSKPIELVSMFGNQEMQTQISPMFSDELSYTQNELKQTPLHTQEYRMIGLNIARSYGDQKDKMGFSVQANGEIKYTQPSMPHPRLSLPFFLSSDIEQWDLRGLIDIIRKEKKREILIQYLKIFNHKVRDIEVQGNSVLVDLEEIPQLIDINLLGEGFKKYTTILAFALMVLRSQGHFCVCIDEIENGLHFSSTTRLLESILELSKYIDIQFFLTTHSLEFLDISRKVLGEESKIFKIVSSGEKTKAYPYSQEGDPYFTLERIDPRGER